MSVRHPCMFVKWRKAEAEYFLELVSFKKTLPVVLAIGLIGPGQMMEVSVLCEV